MINDYMATDSGGAVKNIWLAFRQAKAKIRLLDGKFAQNALMVRVGVVETPSHAWEAYILPLYDTRK